MREGALFEHVTIVLAGGCGLSNASEVAAPFPSGRPSGRVERQSRTNRVLPERVGARGANNFPAERSGEIRGELVTPSFWRASAPSSCQLHEGDRRRRSHLIVPEDGPAAAGSSHCRCPSTRAGVKAPITSLHAPDFALGSPPLTPARGWGAGVFRAGGSDRLVELTSPNFPTLWTSNQHSENGSSFSKTQLVVLTTLRVLSRTRSNAWPPRRSASRSATAPNANGEPARPAALTNPHHHPTMSTPYDDEPIVESQLAGRSCPTCGQPLDEPLDIELAE